jgi:hypothetical protein
VCTLCCASEKKLQSSRPHSLTGALSRDDFFEGPKNKISTFCMRALMVFTIVCCLLRKRKISACFFVVLSHLIILPVPSLKAGSDMYNGESQPMTAKSRGVTEILMRLSAGQSLELVTFSNKQAELFHFILSGSLKMYKPSALKTHCFILSLYTVLNLSKQARI